MQIKSVFTNNERIPEIYTCDGSDINPELEFSDIPKNTKSLVLIMDDPDSPSGNWIHWILFNIPANTKKIERDSIPLNSLQGQNTWGESQYGGPCPGAGLHRYVFKLYAIDTILDLKERSTKSQIESAIKEHIIEKAELIGTYSRSQ